MTMITGLDLQGGDNSSRLQDICTNSPQGTKLELPAGRIRCEKQIYIDTRNKFRMSGQGAATEFYRTNFSTARNQSLFHIFLGSDVSLLNFKYTGTNPYPGMDDRAYDANLEGQHGVEVEGGARVFLFGLLFNALWGDGIYVGANHKSKTISTDVYATDCQMTNIGRQGMSVVGGKNVVATRFVLDAIRHACFDLEPLQSSSDWCAKNVHIFGNILGRHRLLALANKGAGPNVGDVVFRNNLQLDVLRGFLQVFLGSATPDDRSGFWIIDNTSLHGPIADPFQLQRCNNVFIARNKIPTQDEPGNYFIDADYCDYIYHKDNVTGTKNEITGTAYTEGNVYQTPPPTPSFNPYL